MIDPNSTEITQTDMGKFGRYRTRTAYNPYASTFLRTQNHRGQESTFLSNVMAEQGLSQWEQTLHMQRLLFLSENLHNHISEMEGS